MAAAPSRGWSWGLLAVVVLSGVHGLWLGTKRASWQDCVEPSQVLSGVVVYPDPTNPFYMYQTKVATLLHPLSTAALRLGLDEAATSKVVSALLGGVFFVAMSLWLWGLSEDPLLAVSVPPLLAFLGTREWGLRYPLDVLETSATYGAVGLGLGMLAFGLVASRAGGWGGFVAGLAPAFHVVLGAWCLMLLGVALAWQPIPRRAAAIRGGLAGLTLSAAFFGAHFLTAPARPPIDPALARRYLLPFLTGGHQGPLDLGWGPVFFLLAALALAGGWLSGLGEQLSEGGRLLLRISIAATSIGLAVALVHTALGDRSPLLLITAMPCRLLNVAVLAALLTLLGLLWKARAHPLVGLNLAAFLGSCFALRVLDSFEPEALMVRSATLSSLALLLTGALSGTAAAARRAFLGAALPLALLLLDGFWHAQADLYAAAAVAALGLVLGALRGPGAPSPEEWLRARRLAPRALGIGLVAIGGWASIQVARQPPNEFRDRSNDEVLAQAFRRPGMLLVGHGVNPIQILVRRPVLLDTEQVDMLLYVLEAAPAVERIDERIYGVPLRESLVPQDSRELWRERTPEDWAAIAAEFQVTDVITRADWKLDLPELGRNDRYALYSLPRP